MLNKLKYATKNTVIYASGTVLIKLLGLILFPFYTHQLSVADYGVLGILEITSQFLVIFFGINISAGLFRYYYENDEINYRKKLVFNSAVVIVITGICMLIIMYFFTDRFALGFFGSIELSRIILLMGVYSFLEIFNTIPSSLTRIKEQPTAYTIATLIKFLSSVVLIIYFVKYRQLGIAGIYYGQIIGSLSFTVVLLPYLIKNINIQFDVQLIKNLVWLSFPIAIAGIADMIINLSDRYILKIYSSFEDVGVYTAGFKIASAVSFIIMSIKLGITPIIFKEFNTPDQHRFISKVLSYITFILTFFSIIISCFSADIIRLFKMDDVYLNINYIVPLLSFTFVVQLIKYQVAIGLTYVKKTTVVAVNTIVIMVINIGLNVVFIKYFKANGAAIATLLSAILNLSLIYYFAQKYMRMPYELGRITVVLFIGLLFSLAINTIDFEFLMVKTLIVIAFFFALFITLYYLNFFEKVEVARMTQFFNKWKKPKNWKSE